MSPEQGEGLSIDGRTDLYSAGVMLYELLMREKPFAAPTPAALIFKHINEEIPTLPEGLNRFQEIIDNLMAKNPDDRYSSANELIKVLMPLE
jgi:serine/threonine protein kinase